MKDTMEDKKLESESQNEIKKVKGFAGLKRYLEETYEKPIDEIQLEDIDEPDLNFGQENNAEEDAESDTEKDAKLMDDLFGWKGSFF